MHSSNTIIKFALTKIVSRVESRHLSVTLQRLNSDIINKRALSIVGKKESGTSGPANLAKREFSFDFS